MLQPLAILTVATLLNLITIYAIQTSHNLSRFWSLNTLVIAISIVPVQWLLAYIGRFERFPTDMAIALLIAIVMLFAAGMQVWQKTPPGQVADWPAVLRSMAIYIPMLLCAIGAALVKNAR